MPMESGLFYSCDSWLFSKILCNLPQYMDMDIDMDMDMDMDMNMNMNMGMDMNINMGMDMASTWIRAWTLT